MAGGRKRFFKIFTVTLMSAVFVAGALSVGVIADETPEPEPQYATKTTLESGPYNVHTPVTYVYDLETARNHGYTLPQGLYQDYLQSLGLLFPGDKVRILPELDESENDTNRNKNHRTPGKALVVNGAYLDLAAGESYGPILVTESVTYGSGSGVHTYIRELQVIGDNPIMLQGYGSFSATWAYYERPDPDKPGSNIVTDHWSASSLSYIVLPKYQLVEYRYMCNGVQIDKPAGAEFYDDEQNPEVIWAEDVSSRWSQATGNYVVSGTDFRISRPFIEGYYFDSFRMGNNTELISTSGSYLQTTEDGDHYVIKFFNNHHLDFNFKFDNAKHGDETDTMVIMLNYENSSSCGTVTLDANGGKIEGRDSYIFNNYYSFEPSEHQPVREGYVLEGWYKDAELTQLIVSTSDKNCNYTLKGYINQSMPAVTIYAGWADETLQDFNDGDLEVTGIAEKTYNGSAQTQDPVIKFNGKELVKDTDYELLYGENVNASSKVPLYIRGIGAYRGIYKTTFKINPMPLTPVVTPEFDTMVYLGTDPSVSVSTAEGIAITDDDWYVSRSYTKEGRVLTVRLSGNYTGTASVTINVTPLEVEPQITVKTTSYEYDGNEKKPSVTVKVNGSIVYESGNGYIGQPYLGYTREYFNNIEPGEATVRVTMTGFYKGTAEAHFTITRSSPSPTEKPNPTEKPTATPTKKPTVAPTVTLTLDKKTANVVCGATMTLKATLKGSTASVSWKSSNTNIAVVDSKGKVTAKMAGAVTITATAAGKSASCKVTVLYKDVTNSKDFWYTPTYYLTETGVAKGYNNQTEFRPSNECSRAQMVTFLYRLQGEPKTKATSCKFEDVKTTDYFYKPVIWAVERGITTGYSDGTFKPQNVCTRAQTVTFLWRMAGKPKPAAAKSPFNDVKKDDYFYQATIWASEMKIVAGYEDGSFKPQGNCLRRQMVTFLYKYDKYINAKG